MTAKRRDNKGRVLRNGESQRSDGMYMFRYTDCDGKRKSVYSWKLVSTDKLKEGQRSSQALRDIEKRILKDIDDEIRTDMSERTTVDDLFNQFMEIRTDLKESTRCSYKETYGRYIKPFIGNKAVGRIRHTAIQKLYHTLISDMGLSPSTVQTAHSIIYQIFNNAVMDKIIRDNPVNNAFKVLRRTVDLYTEPRNPLTVGQQCAFIDYVYSSRHYGRLANLFTVLLGTGMRISEALGLRLCDCDLEEGIIYVTHSLIYKKGEDGGYRYRISSPKTKAGIREIPMFDDVKAALIREIEKRNVSCSKFTVDGYTDFIFLNNNGKVYTQFYLYDAIQCITTAYNKDELIKAREENRQPCYIPKISAHTFRHTFCTRMSESDVNIKVLQELMGHRNIRTTMETYTKSLKDKKVETIQSLNGAFKIS